MVRTVPRVDIVKEDLKKLKDNMEHEIGDMEVKGTWKMKSVIANENVEFKAGEIKIIKIKHMKIPASYVGLLSSYAINKFGHLIAIGEEVPLPIEMERSADYATFIAAIDGEIKKNDLIGIYILFPVQIYR
jgi:hypothetical protein